MVVVAVLLGFAYMAVRSSGLRKAKGVGEGVQGVGSGSATTKQSDSRSTEGAKRQERERRQQLEGGIGTQSQHLTRQAEQQWRPKKMAARTEEEEPGSRAQQAQHAEDTEHLGVQHQDEAPVVVVAQHTGQVDAVESPGMYDQDFAGQCQSPSPGQACPKHGPLCPCPAYHSSHCMLLACCSCLGADTCIISLFMGLMGVCS